MTDSDETLVGKALWAGGVALIMGGIVLSVVMPVLNFFLGLLSMLLMQ